MRVLLIDDDARLAELLVAYLAPQGVALTHAPGGQAGLAQVAAGGWDAVLLDVMMPGLDGLAVLRQLRAKDARLPVLMLTARGDEVDKVVGLELGADDYVAKPCTPRELVARIRAILRRTARQSAGAAEPAAPAAGHAEPLVAGLLRLWPRSRRAEWRGRELSLTSTQFSVLEALVREAGSVVSKQALSRRALSRPLGRFDRSIDVHISILRQKLDGAGGGEAVIKTVRGIGYQFAVA